MGKEAIIIAGGYSVKEGLDKDLWANIKGKEVWSLNFAFKFMPYLPSRQLWVDITFFRNCIKELQTLHERGVPLYCKENDTQYDNLKMINQVKVFREKTKPVENQFFIGQMGLVGFFALSLAIKEFDTIYLLGYDFGSPNQDDKNTHWYQDLNMNEFSEPIKSNGIKNPLVYLERNNAPKPMIRDFEYYQQFSNKIYNVSSRTNVTTFPIISYDEFFNKIAGVNNESRPEA